MGFHTKGMEMIPAVAYIMGKDGAYTNEKPSHEVHLDSFYIDKYEVTQDQFFRVMKKNPSYFKNCTNCPVENITWFELKNIVRNFKCNFEKYYEELGKL